MNVLLLADGLHPDNDTARRWADHELSKPEYHEQATTPTQPPEHSRNFFSSIYDFLTGGPAPDTTLIVTIVVVLLVITAIAAAIVDVADERARGVGIRCAHWGDPSRVAGPAGGFASLSPHVAAKTTFSDRRNRRGAPAFGAARAVKTRGAMQVHRTREARPGRR